MQNKATSSNFSIIMSTFTRLLPIKKNLKEPTKPKVEKLGAQQYCEVLVAVWRAAKYVGA